ncbi:NAD(P)/FAD-dependent oxidoreductase [Faecalicatena contorta]|uniref:NAD(P)/FAD-dependent oxidoreductase n=1 Tax=Faecalicatena contorta TaxID=39482 RepID=UPI001F31E879|nr:NAD(P)/FAD-dependent oxidoreductase [Faecalicatena contorta]MCF2680449.1 NAD(P)/FAD-dependent oxidoreductase [Faecalicatena contorta]
MSKVLIIGGGAAGMFAAITAARCGHDVWVYEKNEKLGKKLFITGKGRCNITNAGDMETLFSSVVSNSKFMYSSFYGYTNQDVIDFFESAGLHTKIERGDRVFPVSDHSSDVIRCLEQEMRRLHVKIMLCTPVEEIKAEEGRFHHLVLADGTIAEGDACIIATGGLSYPTTGSTGDGYRFAEKLGHKIKPCMPSLVPVEVKEPWITELQGLSLRNVEVTVLDGKKKLYQEFGEMLFTHFGVSGPLIISASSYIGKKLKEKPLSLEIDLKPALSEEALDKRVLRDFEENQNRQFKNAIGKLFPAKLIPVMIELSEIDPEKKVNVISKEERSRFVHLIKHLTMTLTGLRGYNEAIITKGGVLTKEIDPGTMESKLVEGLYFAGEVLDVDALTGGFNLQIAWSTGYAAGAGIRWN